MKLTAEGEGAEELGEDAEGGDFFKDHRILGNFFFNDFFFNFFNNFFFDSCSFFNYYFFSDFFNCFFNNFFFNYFVVSKKIIEDFHSNCIEACFVDRETCCVEEFNHECNVKETCFFSNCECFSNAFFEGYVQALANEKSEASGEFGDFVLFDGSSNCIYSSNNFFFGSGYAECSENSNNGSGGDFVFTEESSNFFSGNGKTLRSSNSSDVSRGNVDRLIHNNDVDYLFFSNCFFFSSFFNDLTFFFGNKHDACIVCSDFFDYRINGSSFFRKNSGSHCSAHKSCKNKRNDLFHL